MSVAEAAVAGVRNLPWCELAEAVVDIVRLRTFWRTDAILEALYHVAFKSQTSEEEAGVTDVTSGQGASASVPAKAAMDQNLTVDDIAQHFAKLVQDALASKEKCNTNCARSATQRAHHSTGDHVGASSERLQRAMNWILHGKEEGTDVEVENDSRLFVEAAESPHAASSRRNRRRPASAGGVTSIGRNRSMATSPGGSAAAKAKLSQAADSVFSRAWALRRLLAAGTSWQDVEDAVLNSHTPRPPAPSNSGCAGRSETVATAPSVAQEQAVGCDSAPDPADRPHVLLKDACTLCGFGGILVCCDGVCRRDFHPGCLGLNVRVPVCAASTTFPGQ